ncbi:GNAT family N-acetyltransferase [Mucilaginibacter ginsenosidivorax]|uniref:GNAT family N-acetyltransferase n=1 Tax=Mucilaginibacter ginsenosidivorax TaxID=862126 RepID=A0A5B8W4N8_9SPHI|nr:GNAT family N-acetyltransferase [Mucilaginibacter ginsenosidivorax]QEC77945.1 GNAT family N-acetyltransferase [Mucilaginibacter ginsenosidivorax]
MHVRYFKEEDCHSLRDIYLVSRKQTFNWFDTSGYSLDDFDRDTEGEKILVADYEGAVIGFISLWLPDNFIHHLFVHPAYSKKGVGKMLLNAAVTMLHKPVTLKCLTRNENALAFYRSQGWQIQERGEGKPGDYFLMSYI